MRNATAYLFSSAMLMASVGRITYLRHEAREHPIPPDGAFLSKCVSQLLPSSCPFYGTEMLEEGARAPAPPPPHTFGAGFPPPKMRETELADLLLSFHGGCCLLSASFPSPILSYPILSHPIPSYPHSLLLLSSPSMSEALATTTMMIARTSSSDLLLGLRVLPPRANKAKLNARTSRPGDDYSSRGTGWVPHWREPGNGRGVVMGLEGTRY